MRSGVVVGNPRPGSRTFQAAVHLVTALTGHAPTHTVDLAAFGADLLDWSHPEVNQTVETVAGLDLIVVASPTFKSSYTGLLKLFLDRFPSNALDGVVAVPLMLGAALNHALAPEVFLKPVLAELGAALPTRALYVLENEFDAPSAYEPWLAASRVRVAAALAARGEAR